MWAANDLKETGENCIVVHLLLLLEVGIFCRELKVFGFLASFLCFNLLMTIILLKTALLSSLEKTVL